MSMTFKNKEEFQEWRKSAEFIDGDEDFNHEGCLRGWEIYKYNDNLYKVNTFGIGGHCPDYDWEWDNVNEVVKHEKIIITYTPKMYENN